jgi:hypothetical protein
MVSQLEVSQLNGLEQGATFRHSHLISCYTAMNKAKRVAPLSVLTY